MRAVSRSPAGRPSSWEPRGARWGYDDLGGKPQTTCKANTLHAPYAPQGSKPITPSPARGRGNRAGDPARGYALRRVYPQTSPSRKGVREHSPLQRAGRRSATLSKT